MHLLGREPQRCKSHEDQAHIAHDAGQAHFGARNVEHHRRLPETAEQHQPHHRAQQRKVDLAVKANRAAVGRGVGLEQLFAAVVVPAVQHKEDGQQRPDGQDGGVEPWAAVQVAANEDAARHSEQRRQQDHERDVFGQQRMHQAHARHCGPEGDGKGQQKRQAPGRSHLAKVVVPEDGSQERHERNRQQDARERHTPQHRQRAAIDVGSHAQAGQQGSGSSHPRRSAARNLHGFVSINALCHRAGPGALRCGAKNHWGFTGVQGCRTPGAGRPGIFRHRTCPCRGCLTAWPPAGRCSGSS